MKKQLFYILFSILALQSTAQTYKDSVLLLNGKSYQCNVIGLEGPSLHFQVENKKGLAEDYYVGDYRIFSFHHGGKETILYEFNEEIGNFLKVDESKRYAIGAYDARQTYHTNLVFWSSFAVGYSMSLWDTYLSPKAFDPVQFPELQSGFFGKSPTMLPFTAPIVLTASFGLPNMRVKDKFILHKNMVNDKMYYNGFNSYSKQKRAFSALKGSALGIGLGMLSYAILKIN